MQTLAENTHSFCPRRRLSPFLLFFSLHCRLSSSGGARPAAYCDSSSLHITEVYQYSVGNGPACSAFPWVRLAWAGYLIKWPLGDGLKVLACGGKKIILTSSPGANTHVHASCVHHELQTFNLLTIFVPLYLIKWPVSDELKVLACE